MRELWHTGTMHNRVRMVAASFLVKHLLIDWREGEKWFWDTLVDADPGSNPANWQWVAGSGADAAPYFRVFNPVLQGEKFDPEGKYVARWVPELAQLPPPLIHQPWRATPLELKAAGLELGADYPADGSREAAAARAPAPNVRRTSLPGRTSHLQNRIEDPKIGRRVGPGARDPLPVGRVAARVGVHKGVPKPLLPLAPIDEKVFAQKRRRHHPNPVVHGPGVPELAHPGVDDRVSGFATLPGAESWFVVSPWEAVERGLRLRLERSG